MSIKYTFITTGERGTFSTDVNEKWPFYFEVKEDKFYIMQKCKPGPLCVDIFPISEIEKVLVNDEEIQIQGTNE